MLPIVFCLIRGLVPNASDSLHVCESRDPVQRGQQLVTKLKIAKQNLARSKSATATG